jgi:hypothetical protein
MTESELRLAAEAIARTIVAPNRYVAVIKALGVFAVGFFGGCIYIGLLVGLGLTS